MDTAKKFLVIDIETGDYEIRINALTNSTNDGRKNYSIKKRNKRELGS